MPTDRAGHTAEIAGLAGLALALCCALPVLLSVGAGITIAGLELRSWLIGASGLVVVIAGLRRYRRRARHTPPTHDRPEH